MKRLYTLAILLFAFYGAFSQSFTLSKKMVNVEGPNSSTEDALSTITNTSTDPADTNFSWNILAYSMPAEWFVSFCDNKDCYSGLSQGMTKNFILKPNASGPLKASFDFQNKQATACMVITVNSVKVPANIDTVTYCATSWRTGIAETNSNRSIAAYPNPVKENLNISFPVKDKVTLEIYNVVGAKVKSISTDQSSNSINVQDLDNGMYFIRIKDKNNTYTKTFTKVN